MKMNEKKSLYHYMRGKKMNDVENKGYVRKKANDR